MRRIASFVAVFLLLTAAAPLLACVMGGSMSPSESACCRAMNSHCGDMAKMGCCQVEVRHEGTAQFPASPVPDVQWLVATQWVPVVFPQRKSTPAGRMSAPDAHSPPGLLIARTTVLRI